MRPHLLLPFALQSETIIYSKLLYADGKSQGLFYMIFPEGEYTHGDYFYLKESIKQLKLNEVLLK